MTRGTKIDFASVQKAEQERIELQRGEEQFESVVGVALSGGGIRSASFALGLLQSLDNADRLKQVDYLSTVSGGGYIGSCWTWLNHCRTKFGSSGTGFPLRQTKGAREPGKRIPLNFIRQHGNFLAPHDGLSSMSLFASILRNVLVFGGVYLCAATCVAFAFIALQDLVRGGDWAGNTIWFAPILHKSIAFWFAVMFAAVSVIITLVYALMSWILPFCVWLSLLMGKSGLVPAFKRATYRLRVFAQRSLGNLLAVVMAFSIIGSVPYIVAYLNKIVFLDNAAIAVGSGATMIGIGGGILQFYGRIQRIGGVMKFMQGFGAQLASLLLIYGILIFAYVLAKTGSGPSWWVYLSVALLFGFIINVNYFGIGRMYRDRLMETFLPNPSAIASGKWELATDADDGKLSEMCVGSPSGRPYHLVNCNVVLVNSRTASYRGRGGDSFTLAPLYSGSDSIGWHPTDSFSSNRMTLPTAMAISGAAANPHAGVAGVGLTRNRFVSFLMSFMGVRLGFWARNPIAPRLQSLIAKLAPNLWYPGFVQGLLGQRYRENAGYIELTDGGHFENLGLYELFRRQVDVIICSDAGADVDFGFGDLANAIERARVDFGTKVTFQPDYGLDALLPGSAEIIGDKEKVFVEKFGLANRAFAVADINYGGKSGRLIYLKTALTKNLSEDIYGFKSRNPTFPDQSTVDQFFDEVQLESYRQLGFELCGQMLEENKSARWF